VGWIESYRRPGGNVTGIYNVNRTLGPKRLEILKEVLPSVSRVAVLYDPALGKHELVEIQQYAPRLGLQLFPITIKSAGDLDDAFNAAIVKEAGAVLLLWTPIVYLERSRVAALGLKHRLPVVSDIHPIVEEGALISLGSDAEYPFERVAFYVDRILNGTPVADLPVEQVSKLKFVVNLRTARELGVEVPQSILLRADKVIE
jgi:putative ABC transport system substrate-binding protein